MLFMQKKFQYIDSSGEQPIKDNPPESSRKLNITNVEGVICLWVFSLKISYTKNLQFRHFGCI